MSTNPERAVSYVLTKYVTEYMDKDVLILDMDTSTRDAATMLRHYETDDIIVIDKKKIPIGIVTDDDILSKVSDATVYAEATVLKQIMTKPLITISDKSTLQDALHKMRDNNVRKLPVISKKTQVVGMILQSTIANAIRDATATTPRLLSPPVKAVLGNLGFVLQFAGVLLLVPAIVATLLEDTVTASGIYLTTVLLLVTGFFLNSYGEKSSLNLQQASILYFLVYFYCHYLAPYHISTCFQVMSHQYRYLQMHSFQVLQDLQQEEFHCLMSQKNSHKVSHFSVAIHS